MIALRDYQRRMVDAIRREWSAGKRVMGCLPTGGGKTEVAIAILAEEATPTNRALIVVALKTLAAQWVDRLRRHGVRHVGLLQGANTIATSAPVLVAMAQTLRSRGVPEGVGLIVIDESHVWHQTHDRVLDAVGDARVLGLSATPLRDGLGERFDSVVVGATIRELQGLGHLVRARYFAPGHGQIQAALDKVVFRGGDFAVEHLSMALRGKAILGDVVGTWQRLGDDRQTIAFAVDKAHARDLADQFELAGVVAAVVLDDTDDETRAQVLADFNDKRVRVLVSVGVLSIGFDSPIASCAILARPTMSLSLHVQQGGRVLRPFPGKDDALILDHSGNTLRHGFLEDFTPTKDLSMIDAKADKAMKNAPATSWVCKHCAAINALTDNTCCTCGEPRRKLTSVIVLDGELRSVEHAPDETLPGPTPEEMQTFHRMMRWFADAKGLKPGFAWHKTRERFGIESDERAKRLIPYHWNKLPPLPPDDECSRWLCTANARRRIIDRARGKQGHTA